MQKSRDAYENKSLGTVSSDKMELDGSNNRIVVERKPNYSSSQAISIETEGNCNIYGYRISNLVFMSIKYVIAHRLKPTGNC